jgi:hypothetical protein
MRILRWHFRRHTAQGLRERNFDRGNRPDAFKKRCKRNIERGKRGRQALDRSHG